MLKTHYLNPVYHSNVKTVFKLPEAVLRSEMLLMNIGAENDQSNNYYYQWLNGCLGLIDSVSLQVNGQPIDELTEAHSWLAFQQMRKSNEQNRSVEHNTVGTRWGFGVEKYDRGAGVNQALLGFKENEPLIRPQGVLAPERLGMLNLSRCLGLLRDSEMLPPMANVSVVIRWRTDAQNVFEGNTQANTAVVSKINEPSLFVNEVVDEKLTRELSNKAVQIPHFSMERDSVRVAAVVDGDESGTQLFRVSGFQNKFVRRCVLVNEFLKTVAGAGADRVVKHNDCSASMHDERWNLRVNNANLFTGRGVFSENRKLDTLADAWGPINILQSTQYDGLHQANNLLTGSNAENLRGRVSYGGCKVGQRINDLQIQYSRTGSTIPKDSMGTSEFTLACWAEVGKVVNVSHGRVNVAYA